MKFRKTGQGWTVSSVPIEFVLVGPKTDDVDASAAMRQRSSERDAVLVRSANLKPDLLALAIESRDGDASPLDLLIDRASRHRPALPSDLLRVLFGFPGGSAIRLRKINAVRGETAVSADKRGSNYVFAWAGKVDTFGKEVVESAVRRYLPDLRAGLKGEDMERIEWALAPIVYHCMLVTTGTTDVQDNTRKFARQARLNSYFSILMAMIALFFWLVSTIYLVSRTINK